MQADATRALVVILLTALVLQGLKVILDVARTKTFRRRYLRSSGGFPSFHA
ncbi:MAG: divergent PAP2 family protein [Candidatus Peribacteria bacterium]|nr:MAG: divergent PAP2 family protein [Candidatus Peribacteria bacterium]